MTRIILTATTDLTYDQRMQRIAGSLQSAGYDVLLVGRRKRNSLPLREESYRQYRLFCRFEAGKFFYLEYNLRLLFFLLFRRADVLCAVDLDSILPVTLVGGLYGRKRVYDAHEYFTETPEVVRRPRIQRIWEWIARRCVPRMDSCYTVGPRLAAIMGRKYGLPFGVVRNLPLAAADHQIPSDRTPGVLLYQGALNEGRGLEAMIAALPLLPPEITLWLAGEGDLSEALRAEVADRGLQERVRFLGYLEPVTLRKCTPQAWLGLNLLENRGESYYYSLANKAFDYVQAGIPSLQMDFPEYRALQEEHPCFVLVSDLKPDTLAQEIRRLLDQPQTYENLARACKQAANRWVWELEEKRLFAIYKNL